MNSDQDEISSWAFNYIGFVINQRLMSGMGDGTFAPQEPFTVEQAMWRMAIPIKLLRQ